jgi:nucleoid-associated protein YgaU
MKRTFIGKQLVPVVMVLGLVVGCASAPKEEPMKESSAEATQAIDSAKAAIAKAKSLNWIWRDTEKFLKQAEEKAAAGDGDAAIKLANKARNQAELAVNQYYLEKAKVMFSKANSATGLTANQQNTLTEAGKAITNSEGRKAYDLLTPLLTELHSANIQYQVVRGDSLWAIAGKQEIYGNPYQWPLIFKSNRDQIKDADLIYPGQDFSINRNPSAAESEMAINHAKTRGAWSIGVVEESDRNFLGGSLDLQ